MAELPSIDDIGPPDLERQFYNLPKSLIESNKIIQHQGKKYVIPKTATKEDFLKGNTDFTSLRNFIDFTRADMLRKREDIIESDSMGNKAYFGFMDLLNNTTGRLFPNIRKENLEILGKMRQAQYVSPETRDTVAEYFGTSTEDIDEDLDRIEFAKGDVAELPDVGSIDTLLEEKALQKKLLSLSEKERRKYFEDRRRQLKKYQEFFDNKPLMNKSQSGLAIMLAADRLRDLDLLTRKTNKNRPTIESLESEIQNLRNEKRMMQMNFAEGDVVELPDVGSIQPLTEAEKRKAFGTPLTRALKMDPISLERSPVKRGIASIGSNILDMLPGFSLQKGIEEGDPVQMGMGITDLIPGAALLKVGSKAVTDLANKLARMAPEEIAAVKQQYNPVFRNIYEQQERIINAPNANPADVAAAREVQRKINANYSIMFDNAGKKFDG